MMQSELPERVLAFWGKRQQNFAAIFAPALPAGVAAGFDAVDQFYRAVMLDLYSFGQFANAWANSPRQPFYRQHELILAWLQAGGAGCLLAEMQEAAYVVSNFGEGLVILQG